MTACPIEDRLALEDLTIAYAHAVDSLSDIDGICACFTQDVDYDLTGIGMAHVAGHAGVREFFAGVFAANSHHAHYLSNFTVTAFAGDTALTDFFEDRFVSSRLPVEWGRQKIIIEGIIVFNDDGFSFFIVLIWPIDNIDDFA